MHPEWRNFLQVQGARFAHDVSAHFGDAPAERAAANTGNVVVDLSHLALIRAEGADTVTFLQGQLSNDVRLVNGERSQLTSHSTAKGRMLAILRLLQRDSEFLLQLPASLREGVVKRLRMYVLRAKVTLAEADDLVPIGVSGSDARALVERAAGFVPGDDRDGCKTQGATSILSLPAGRYPRYEIIAPVAEAQHLWASLAGGARQCAAPVWSWLDIVAGVPTVLPETSEQFVPQMTNLEVLDGVNFKKGCYPGQEIVARVQYLGQLKQRMFAAHAPGADLVRPGEPVYAASFGEQAAGTVVDAQPAPAGGYDLLVVLQLSARDSSLHLRRPDGEQIQLGSLPYSLPPPPEKAERGG